MLSIIDEMDARMNEMEAVTRRTPRGVFSEKIWSLDRRLNHRHPGRTGNFRACPFHGQISREGYEGLL